MVVFLIFIGKSDMKKIKPNINICKIFFGGCLLLACASLHLYARPVTKTILDLQKFSITQSMTQNKTEISLTELNSNFQNAYVLRFKNLSNKKLEFFHLESVEKISLDEKNKNGFLISEKESCPLWDLNKQTIEAVFEKEKSSTIPYTSLCS